MQPNFFVEVVQVKLSVKAKTLLATALFTLFAAQSFAISDAKRDAISERLKPIGEVCVEGDSGCAAAVAVSSGPKSADDIYNSSCMACHATGAAGAPKVGDKAAWAARIAQGSDTLHKHAIEGLNGMPAMGLCMSCSEDEIKATVDFMVKKSK
jgi:cytochrome c5